MKIYSFLFIILILILRVIPVAVTFLFPADIIFSEEKDSISKKRLFLSSIVVFIFHALVYFISLVLTSGRLNIVHLFLSTILFKNTAQEMKYLCYSIIICCLFGIVAGLVLRFIASKGFFAKPSLSTISKAKKEAINRFTYPAILSFVAFTLAFSFVFYSDLSDTTLMINEVCGNNSSVAVNSYGDVCDFVELYNNGHFACSTEDLYLSDDDDKPLKYKIPTEIIMPYERFVVPLSSDDSFGINKLGGETISLNNSAGTRIDGIETISTNEDCSYMRVSDGDKEWTIKHATPWTKNIDAYVPSGKLTFSQESGFYDDAFTLFISAPENFTIYYTLDGSLPTKDSEKYENGIEVYDKSSEPNIYLNMGHTIQAWNDEDAYNRSRIETPVDKAFIIRAIGVYDDGVCKYQTDVSSMTYFIDKSSYKDKNVISIMTDPDKMWGEDGIAVTGKAHDEWVLSGENGDDPGINYMRKGKDWEIPVSFEFFSDNLSLSQDCGIRISGGYSRALPIKRFNLYSRKQYSGSSTFNQVFFNSGNTSHSISLRPSYMAHILKKLVDGRDVGVQDSEAVTVFINGEKWYDCNLLERFDGNYYQEHYGIDKDNILSVKAKTASLGEEDLVLSEWKKVYEYISEHDLKDDDNYKDFSEIIDVQSYIDFMSINIFLDNMDITDTKNFIAWKVKDTDNDNPYADGRWRFNLYDIDAMERNDSSDFNLSCQAEKNSIELLSDTTNGVRIKDITLFSSLLRNKEFRESFLKSFDEICNTCFDYTRVKAVLDNDEYFYTDYSKLKAKDKSYYYDFFEKRPEYITKYVHDFVNSFE